MAPTALNLPRELARRSGKASPSARDLALGEGRFTVRSVTGSPSSSVALAEGFPECFFLPQVHLALGEAGVSRSVLCSLFVTTLNSWPLTTTNELHSRAAAHTEVVTA
jgi:hypothetical protein